MKITYNADISQLFGISSSLVAFASIISLVIFVWMLVCNWKIFTKVDYPGWYSIVPILNVFKLFELANGNGWTMLFMFVPILNVIYGVMTIHRLCKEFGYGIGVTLLYFVMPIVALTILAFGRSEYYG